MNPLWTDVGLFWATLVAAVVAAAAATATIIIAIQAKRSSDQSVKIAKTAVDIQRDAQKRGYEVALDAALGGVILGLKRRYDELVDYESTWTDKGTSMPPGTVGGPPIHDLQSSVEIAWMTARGADLVPLQALGDLTFNLPLGGVTWVKPRLGEWGGDIRKWRTGEMSSETFIEKMNTDARYLLTWAERAAREA